MKKTLFGIVAIMMISLSSCSIFIRTKHHSAGVGVSQNAPSPDPSKTTAQPAPAGK